MRDREHRLVRDNHDGDRMPRANWRCSCGAHAYQDVTSWYCTRRLTDLTPIR